MVCHALFASAHLGLVDEETLGVVDNEAVLGRLLLGWADFIVLGTLVVQIFLVRLLIRVVARPDDAALVMRALRAQAKLKGLDKVVSHVRMLSELRTITVPMCAHPYDNLPLLVKNDRIVVLTHFSIFSYIWSVI